MNDNDKEAFETWFKDDFGEGDLPLPLMEHTWQAACEYKQKEIDELDEISEYLADGYNHVKAENKKLVEAIEYALEWSGDTNAWNRLNDALKKHEGEKDDE